MNTMKNNICTLLVIAALFLFTFQTGCSSTKTTGAASSNEEITQAINSDQWIFEPLTVMPQSGRSRNADPGYDVRCGKDTLLVYLPYIGRSYSGAGVNNTKGPLDFKTTDFSYSKEKGKKDEWLVTIQPKDNMDVQTLSFTLFDNGSASLSVNMKNRSPISFSGRIKPKK